MTDITTQSTAPTTDLDQLGPVDYVVVEFPKGASSFTGEMATELVRLVDSGIIRGRTYGLRHSRRRPDVRVAN
jgi:hypothetical protein